MDGHVERIAALTKLVQDDEVFAACLIKAMRSKDAKAVIQLAGEKGVILLEEDFFLLAKGNKRMTAVGDDKLRDVAGGISTEGAHAWEHQLALALFGPSFSWDEK